MNTETSEIISKIRNSLNDDDFYNLSYDFAEELENLSDKFDAVEPILQIIENNPDVDFGNPGPFVHFIESFYKNGYEDELIKSINRKPVLHNLWMLNRLINGSDGSVKTRYLNELDKKISNKNLPKEVVEEAKNFRELHS